MKKLLMILVFGFVLSLVFSVIVNLCYTDDGIWGEDVRLTNDPADSSVPYNNNAWYIATDTQGRLHVVWDDNRDGAREIYYKRSLDAGNTWGPDTRLTYDFSSSAAAIATDSQNRVHVVWNYGWSGNHEIHYRRSLDGGATWEAETVLSTIQDSFFLDPPSIATDSQGRVHVVWAYDGQYLNDQVIYYKRSLDGGVTWEADTLLVNSGYAISPSIATDSQNRVYVAWQDHGNINYDIFFKCSLDGGATWEADTRLTFNGSGASSSCPSIAADSQNRVHVVRQDYRNGNDEIYYKRSLDAGETWEADIRLTVDSAWSQFPSIATDTHGRVHVVWNDYSYANNFEIYYKRSLDAGANWEAEALLTFGSIFRYVPSIATDSQSRIHVAWSNDEGGNPENYEIYYKRGRQNKKWTVMVYCAADNSLDLNGVEDLNELEYAGSSNDVNMIYLLDRNGINDTRLYYVLNDPNGLPDGSDMNIISQDISANASWLAQEEDMGNPQTLQDFCLWTMQNYPAQHYFLSIWDHGDGIFLQQEEQGIFKGECWDDHGGIPGEYIDLAELRDVLSAMYTTNGNRKIDIVGHDVCVLGQIETHYQMKDYVSYGIASEEYEPADGWDYGFPFEELINNPNMAASNLASRIVHYYGQRYGAQSSATLAAVDLQALQDSLIPKLNNFAGYLFSYMDDFNSEIAQARANTESYNNDAQNPEFFHFAQLIYENQNIPQKLRGSALALSTVYPQTVIANWHGNQSPNAYGMTIWFPEDYTNNSHYNDYLIKINFSQEKWDEFLEMYEFPYEVLSVTMNPQYSIIPRGQTLNYAIEVSNLSWVSHTLKGWTELYLPDGSPYPDNPFLGPSNLNIGPTQNLQYDLDIYIPLYAPLGIYTYTGKMSTTDNFLLDEDYLEFEVIAK